MTEIDFSNLQREIEEQKCLNSLLDGLLSDKSQNTAQSDLDPSSNPKKSSLAHYTSTMAPIKTKLSKENHSLYHQAKAASIDPEKVYASVERNVWYGCKKWKHEASPLERMQDFFQKMYDDIDLARQRRNKELELLGLTKEEVIGQGPQALLEMCVSRNTVQYEEDETVFGCLFDDDDPARWEQYAKVIYKEIDEDSEVSCAPSEAKVIEGLTVSSTEESWSDWSSSWGSGWAEEQQAVFDPIWEVARLLRFLDKHLEVEYDPSLDPNRKDRREGEGQESFSSWAADDEASSIEVERKEPDRIVLRVTPFRETAFYEYDLPEGNLYGFRVPEITSTEEEEESEEEGDDGFDPAVLDFDGMHFYSESSGEPVYVGPLDESSFIDLPFALVNIDDCKCGFHDFESASPIDSGPFSTESKFGFPQFWEESSDGTSCGSEEEASSESVEIEEFSDNSGMDLFLYLDKITAFYLEKLGKRLSKFQQRVVVFKLERAFKLLEKILCFARISGQLNDSEFDELMEVVNQRKDFLERLFNKTRRRNMVAYFRENADLEWLKTLPRVLIQAILESCGMRDLVPLVPYNSSGNYLSWQEAIGIVTVFDEKIKEVEDDVPGPFMKVIGVDEDDLTSLWADSEAEKAPWSDEVMPSDTEEDDTGRYAEEILRDMVRMFEEAEAGEETSEEKDSENQEEDDTEAKELELQRAREEAELEQLEAIYDFFARFVDMRFEDDDFDLSSEYSLGSDDASSEYSDLNSEELVKVEKVCHYLPTVDRIRAKNWGSVVSKVRSIGLRSIEGLDRGKLRKLPPEVFSTLLFIRDGIEGG